jgi:hypothetical protein
MLSPFRLAIVHSGILPYCVTPITEEKIQSSFYTTELQELAEHKRTNQLILNLKARHNPMCVVADIKNLRRW